MMCYAFDTKSDAKWITIHPGNSDKGVHVQVNGDGRVVGGNSHLVKALNAESPDHDDNNDGGLGTFTPPSDDDFGDDIFNGSPLIPKEDEFGDLFGEENPKKAQEPSLDVFKFSEQMKSMTYDEAHKKIEGTFKKCFDDAYDAIHSMFPHYGYYSTQSALKDFAKGSKSSRQEAYKAMAVTLNHLGKILKSGAIEFKKVKFVPCRTQNSISSYTIYANNPERHLNIAVPTSKTLESLEYQQKKLSADKNYKPFNVQARFPLEDAAYLTICHELAHCAYDTRKLKSAWMEAFEAAVQSDNFSPRDVVSRYAMFYESKKFTYSSRLNECHSECFAMMCHPNYKRGTLPKGIEDYFDKNFFSIDQQV